MYNIIIIIYYIYIHICMYSYHVYIYIHKTNISHVNIYLNRRRRVNPFRSPCKPPPSRVRLSGAIANVSDAIVEERSIWARRLGTVLKQLVETAGNIQKIDPTHTQ